MLVLVEKRVREREQRGELAQVEGLWVELTESPARHAREVTLTQVGFGSLIIGGKMIRPLLQTRLFGCTWMY